MKSFSQALNEIFDSSVPYKTEIKSQHLIDFTFEVEGQTFIATLHNESDGIWDSQTWDFQYGNALRDNTGAITHVNIRGGQYKAEIKQPFAIYGTLIKILTDFFKANPLKKGDRITFRSRQGKKVSDIYEIVAKKVGSTLGLRFVRLSQGFGDANFELYMK